MFAFTAAALGAIPATWDLDEGSRHRWVVESEVTLTHHLWLYADFNRDIRARAVTVQLVVDCVALAPAAHAGHLACTVEDASLTGLTYPSERGRMQPVLDEADAKLTGAALDLVIRDDGHLRAVRLRTTRVHASTNERTRTMEETLRALVVRAFASLDLVIPKGGFEEGGWPQYESLAFGLPTLRGTAGSGELVHRASRWAGEQVVIASQGRAMLVDGARLDDSVPMFLDTRIAGYTVFDLAGGRVAEARWETLGEPTASSGPTRRFYAARSELRALAPDERVELAPTAESFTWLPGSTAL